AGKPSGANPLTFGDLEEPDSINVVDNAVQHEPNITLRMVTSNLSQNQPYVLPFDNELFLFKRQDFEKFFPAPVVNYLISHSPEHKLFELAQPLKGQYFFLACGKDMPVIVAARLSLSFPILLSAVPLYTVSPEKIAAASDSKRPVSI